MEQALLQNRFDELRCCVVVPTYNNAGTLDKVLRGILNYTRSVIVVNDGSTDLTPVVLRSFPGLEVISFARNKGKGFALRKAFRRAVELGYETAIALDSDGQHMPEDFPVFLQKIEEMPGALIVGARNMKQENVPGTSSFGNRFSNFWFRVETGIKLPDTQSGYRAYPVRRMSRMKFLTRRFEFEIEVMVRAAWKGIPVVSVPVQVFYAPKGERVSHFRPFTDFARISLLNTLLVLIAFLFVKPFRFVRALNRKNIRDFFDRELIRSKDSDAKIATSVGVGVLLGVLPFWGWQMAIALLIAVAFKLNKVITLVASNISIPPMIPVIVYLSYVFGGLVLPGRSVQLDFSSSISLQTISLNLAQYLIGSVIFGLVLSPVLGFLVFVLLKIFRRKSRKALPDQGMQS